MIDQVRTHIAERADAEVDPTAPIEWVIDRMIGNTFRNAADQPIWRDPETGYRRRHASAQNVASGVEIIVVDLPGGARVPYSPWGRRAYTQQLLVLSGKLTVHIDLKRFDLNEGDCLDFDVMRAVTFENPGEALAKYIVIVRTK